jgi:hypothetical protein
MGPIAHAERHDGPGLSFELVPGITAVIEDCVSIFEHAVGQPRATRRSDAALKSALSAIGFRMTNLLRSPALNQIMPASGTPQ